jgi:hypothetical protein
MHKSCSYRSYLLRIWCEQRDGVWVWRASLESAQTGERRGFPTLEELLGFLSEQTGTVCEQDCKE